jgi:hypothetical protein
MGVSTAMAALVGLVALVVWLVAEWRWSRYAVSVTAPVSFRRDR